MPVDDAARAQTRQARLAGPILAATACPAVRLGLATRRTLNDTSTVTIVFVIVESESAARGVRLPCVFGLPNANHVVTLTCRADCVRDVVEFMDHRGSNGCKADC